MSAQPVFRKRWHAGKQYSEEYGLRLNAQKIWGRFVLSGGMSWMENRYDDAYINGFLRGGTGSASFQSRYILNDRTFVQAGLSVQREQTRAAAYGSDSLRCSLGAYRVLPRGFSLFGELSLNATRYRDEQWYVTRDYRIDTARREDKTWQFFMSLSSSLLIKYRIAPVLQYVYVKRDSNIWSREYKRHRINLFFSRNFCERHPISPSCRGGLPPEILPCGRPCLHRVSSSSVCPPWLLLCACVVMPGA